MVQPPTPPPSPKPLTPLHAAHRCAALPGVLGRPPVHSSQRWCPWAPGGSGGDLHQGDRLSASPQHSWVQQAAGLEHVVHAPCAPHACTHPMHAPCTHSMHAPCTHPMHALCIPHAHTVRTPCTHLTPCCVLLHATKAATTPPHPLQTQQTPLAARPSSGWCWQAGRQAGGGHSASVALLNSQGNSPPPPRPQGHPAPGLATPQPSQPYSASSAQQLSDAF